MLFACAHQSACLLERAAGALCISKPPAIWTTRQYKWHNAIFCASHLYVNCIVRTFSIVLSFQLQASCISFVLAHCLLPPPLLSVGYPITFMLRCFTFPSPSLSSSCLPLPHAAHCPLPPLIDCTNMDAPLAHPNTPSSHCNFVGQDYLHILRGGGFQSYSKRIPRANDTPTARCRSSMLSTTVA